MPQTTILHLPYGNTAAQGPAERLGRHCGRLLDRAILDMAALLPVPERDRLASMSEARLRDIGLTRDGVMEEPRRPFWLG